MKYKILGKTGFNVSLCGFGGYRVDYNFEEHFNSMLYAIKKGINLIDTSANYTNGNSEFLIQKVISEALKEEIVSRKDLIIVTKAGYIQGLNIEMALRLEAEGKLYPDVTKCGEGFWHCIHPEFLEEQITLSLGRLNLEQIDVFLLHNPEHYLSYDKSGTPEERKEEYYRRIKESFEYLEQEVERGRIKYYGVSSNTFVASESKKDFTCLEKLIELAGEVSPDNHFAVIQMPFNLTERGAAVMNNQANGGKSVLKLASENNIGVLINRPLNAIKLGKLQRLKEFKPRGVYSKDDFFKLFDSFEVYETELRLRKINYLPLSHEERENVNQNFALAPFIKNSLDGLSNPVQLEDLSNQRLLPHARYFVEKLADIDDGYTSLKDDLNIYFQKLVKLLDSMQSILAKETNKKNIELHHRLDCYLSPKQHSLSLSAKAILLINSLGEVSCTLVGMRQKDYVDDVIASINADFTPQAEEYWFMEQ